MIGASPPRVEDARFLRGEGRYVADLRLPGMLEAVVVRSPYGHARLLSIDTAEALALPGIHAVITGADLPPGIARIPCRVPTHGEMSGFLQPVLGREVARYFGEPFAVVIAENRSLAEDAAELIEFDWDPLPALASGEDAEKPDAPRLHEAGNIASRWGFDLGDVDRAKTEAAAVVEETFTSQRHTAMPLETRGLLASYDAARNLLEVFGPTKVPHTNRAILAGMLDMPEGDIRFVEPDVGGSFGARGEFYPEDFLIPWIALRLKRPIRWIEDRLEHFAAINHSREMRFTLTACADAEGRITAFDVKLLADMGAYIRTHGDIVPSHAAAQFPGPYRLRNYRCQAVAALTNKTPTGTLRAPGMFEANFARERAVDRLAAQLGLDPAELRRRNLIRPEELPWNTGTESANRPVIYDSGDFPDVLARALNAFGWDKPRAAQNGPLRRGRGIAVVVEPSAFGPFEAARVEIDVRGRVEVISGCSSQGQGHETVLAQVAAEVLRVPLESIRVRHGDTGLLRYGGG
ncbi:MAG: xanthine dehydrogenase family protein molybdopterin-binding subunit, partial [Rhodovibrionaceae bacterium]